MKKRKLLAVLMIALLTIGLLVGCGAAPMENAAGNGKYESADMVVPEAESPNYGLNSSTGSATDSTAVTPQNQKLIRTVYMDAETEDMDVLLSQVEERIVELGGYVEAREIYNGSMYSSTRYRNASLTIRIPADRLDEFINHVSEVSNITSNRETTQDVTLQYVAIESRITALETEEARLLELLAQAESMNDLLIIESRLTEVRTELEQITSQLRVYDNLVDYGTIHLEVSEVVEYTEPEPENAWQRMGNGFVKSLKGLGNGLKEFFIWLVTALPYLILIAAIPLAIVLIIRGSIKRKRKKKAAQQKPEE